MKNWHTGKDPDTGKEEKGMTEDEMVGWHHLLDRHEFEQSPGVGDGQGSLVCFIPWGQKESDISEWLNWTDYEIVQLEECKTIFKDLYLFSDFTKTPSWSQQLGLPISIMILHISLAITSTRVQAKALNVGHYIKLLLKHLGKIHAW